MLIRSESIHAEQETVGHDFQKMNFGAGFQGITKDECLANGTEEGSASALQLNPGTMSIFMVYLLCGMVTMEEWFLACFSIRLRSVLDLGRA